jgi:hypothetical protein
VAGGSAHELRTNCVSEKTSPTRDSSASIRAHSRRAAGRVAGDEWQRSQVGRGCRLRAVPMGTALTWPSGAWGTSSFHLGSFCRPRLCRYASPLGQQACLRPPPDTAAPLRTQKSAPAGIRAPVSSAKRVRHVALSLAALLPGSSARRRLSAAWAEAARLFPFRAGRGRCAHRSRSWSPAFRARLAAARPRARRHGLALGTTACQPRGAAAAGAPAVRGVPGSARLSLRLERWNDGASHQRHRLLRRGASV